MSEPEANQAGPSRWRVLGAFFVAPLVAAFVFATVLPAYAGLSNIYDRIFRTCMLYLAFAAYPQTLILGVPVYFILRTRLRPSPLNCALAGAFVASLPWAVLGFLSTADYSFDGGHVTAVHGHKTIWGWIDLATDVGQIAIIGLFAGFIFWLVAVPTLRRPKPIAA